MTGTTRIVIATTVVLLAATALAQSGAQHSFDQLKSLAGTWEGKNSMNMDAQVSFRVSGNGSAVMSEITGKGEDMISMFHLDGPTRLMMTHYCAAGNQPRMQATSSSDGKVITFKFFDGTNITPAEAGHMQSLVVTLIDANHHTEEWTFASKDKELKELFDLHRKI